MRRVAATCLCLLMLLSAGACKKKGKSALDEQRFTEEVLWDRADKAIADGDQKDAIRYLKLLLDQYPTGKRVKEAHLRYADALFAKGSDANLIEAQAKYLSYLSFYPEDEKADDAQFRVALCNYERRGRSDRDQAVTRDAINELEKLLQSYPKTGHADDARRYLRELKDELAGHEHVVARFYARRGYESSCTRRLKFLLDKYPDYSHRDEVYYLLAQTLLKEEQPAEAAAFLEKLLKEYPTGALTGDAQELLADARRDAGNVGKESEGETRGGGEGGTPGAPPAGSGS